MIQPNRAVAVAALVGVALASRVWASDAAKQDEAVAIGPGYHAGGFHRWLWGSDYRDLWTTPITVEVLDLQTFAGGLTPVKRVGGQQTKGLAMKGKDGRDYTFRAIDKDPTEILPEELRDTWARDIVQDQMAAQHPASPFVVDELMAAAGILRTEQKLVVMPDDPALGEFRKDFAGLVGQIYEFVGAVSDKNPGFQGATELLKHEDFYKKIEASPDEQVDVRAFLRARLFDILIGDWDRHRDQWRWAKFPGNPLWQPMPDDRDQAFSRYEGLVLGLVRPRARILQNFGDRYPKITGLTWNGWEQDRQFFAGLDRSVFRETAADLKSKISDEVIERAAHRMPPEYFKIDGPRLVRQLKARRDRLSEEADVYYEHIADKVKVILTDAPEYVELRWLDKGDLQVNVLRRGSDGGPSGDPILQRTLHANETQEVQIYLRGGDDKVVTLGTPGGIEIRVIAGAGKDVVDDSKGGGTHFYELEKGQMTEGPGSRLSDKPYTPPPTPKNAPWVPPRDWGRDTFLVPWLNYGSDLGVFIGIGVDTKAFGFRKDPYANRHVLRAGWAFGDKTFRADYAGIFRLENSRAFVGVFAYASGIESTRFFGFGNETSDNGDRTRTSSGSSSSSTRSPRRWACPSGKNVMFLIGPTVKFATHQAQGRRHARQRATAVRLRRFRRGRRRPGSCASTRAKPRPPRPAASRCSAWDTRGAAPSCRPAASYWPKAWDVTRTFGSVEGSAAVYLTPGGKKAPTLALRAGGKKVFGDYPFFEAAYLGGGGAGFELNSGDATVRGLQKHRYAGDAAVFGNADLRLYVSRFNIFLPGEWGVLGFADGGRVYLEGDNSDKWHTGFGGGHLDRLARPRQHPEPLRRPQRGAQLHLVQGRVRASDPPPEVLAMTTPAVPAPPDSKSLLERCPEPGRRAPRRRGDPGPPDGFQPLPGPRRVLHAEDHPRGAHPRPGRRRGEDVLLGRAGADAAPHRPGLRGLRLPRQPDPARAMAGPLLRLEPGRLLRPGPHGREARHPLFPVDGHLQRDGHRAVLGLRQRHLHARAGEEGLRPRGRRQQRRRLGGVLLGRKAHEALGPVQPDDRGRRHSRPVPRHHPLPASPSGPSRAHARRGRGGGEAPGRGRRGLRPHPQEPLPDADRRSHRGAERREHFGGVPPGQVRGQGLGGQAGSGPRDRRRPRALHRGGLRRTSSAG